MMLRVKGVLLVLSNLSEIYRYMKVSAFLLGEELELRKVEYKLHRDLWNQFNFPELDLSFGNWSKIKYLNINATAFNSEIENVPEFCYSASFDEVAKKDFSLVPSKYIEFVNRDENIDFDEKMQTLQREFAELLKAEAQSKNDLLTVFKELGYEIKL